MVHVLFCYLSKRQTEQGSSNWPYLSWGIQLTRGTREHQEEKIHKAQVFLDEEGMGEAKNEFCPLRDKAWRNGRSPQTGGRDPSESFPFLLVSLDLNFSEPSFPALPLHAALGPGFQAGIYMKQGALPTGKPALSIKERDRGGWHVLGYSPTWALSR